MTYLIRPTVAVASALTFWCGLAAAQQTESPERLLQRAIATLDSAETERGADLLRSLLSSVPLREASGVRVEARVHLGAATWALGQTDSATVHFREAVRLDPFYVPDPDLFNPELRALFQSVRLATTAVRLRAPADTTLAPGRDRYDVSVAVGRPGDVTVRLRNTAARTGALIATMSVDGVVAVNVPLTAADGSTLEAGSYELEAEVTTADGRQTDLLTLNVNRLAVDTLDHEPPLPDSIFRPEFLRGSPSLFDLGRGLGFGLAAAAVPTLLSNRDLRDNFIQPKAVAVGAVIALADIVASRPMRPVAENIEHNNRLRDEWEATNRRIVADNERLRNQAGLRIRVGGEQ